MGGLLDSFIGDVISGIGSYVKDINVGSGPLSGLSTSSGTDPFTNIIGIELEHYGQKPRNDYQANEKNTATEISKENTDENTNENSSDDVTNTLLEELNSSSKAEDTSQLDFLNSVLGA